MNSSIRNIFQAREIKNGLPAFQVGPTCYRGLWVVDGSFILEAMTYVGLADEVRSGIKYLLGFQRPDGSFMLINGHWKETGIVLWAVARHAQLTGDTSWLEEIWPRIEKGVAAIRAMRAMPPPGAPNAGLIPDGFSDGGIGGPFAEYTNLYWTMVGLGAAAEAAAWLGKSDQADEWRKEFEDFLATYRKAAERDARDDGKGNRCLPIRMDGKDLPLLEGLPAAWVKPGGITRLRDVATSFGPVSLELAASAGGREARLVVTPPARRPPSRIVLHLGGWSAAEGTVDLPARGSTDRRIPLRYARRNAPPLAQVRCREAAA